MGQQRRTVALAAWAVLANLACGSITEGGGKPPLWKKGLRFCRAGNCHSTQTLAGRRHSFGANLPGGFIHHDASLVRELRHRSGLAWKTYSTCKNKVFLAYRGMAFFMLRPDRPPEEAMHMRGVRALAILGLPPIATLLHVARLRHLLCGIRYPHSCSPEMVPCRRRGLVWVLGTGLGCLGRHLPGAPYTVEKHCATCSEPSSRTRVLGDSVSLRCWTCV